MLMGLDIRKADALALKLTLRFDQSGVTEVSTFTGG